MLLGAVARLAAGEHPAAAQTAETLLATAERLGSALAGPCRVLLARLERAAGGGGAEQLVHRDLAGTLDAGLLVDVPDALEVLGGLAVDAGSAAEGARLLAAAAVLDAASGRHRWFAATADRDRDRRHARGRVRPGLGRRCASTRRPPSRMPAELAESAAARTPAGTRSHRPSWRSSG